MLQVGAWALGNMNMGSASHLHSSLLRTAHLSELGKAGPQRSSRTQPALESHQGIACR